ncbi:MAG: CRISPR-associated protein Csn1 [Bacteroidaceae bacterium]|nr:CRISPR-associated protein Csn1 [Bacteroidaceae bacterium]
MTKILGLDLGTNSIGWAITEQLDDHFTLLDRGVDIFQEGVAREKGEEKPMVKARTDARALRRHYYRRRLRKIELLKVLVANNLCPHLEDELLDAWRYKKQYPLEDEFMAWLRSGDSSNPYADRYKSLTEVLDLKKQEDRYTLGRALYHLSQRRGFLSNRKDSESSEDGKVKGAIKQLDEDMVAAGCTYLGEFYYKLFLAGEKIRTGDEYGYAGRIAHYEKEFNAICEKQRLSDDLRKALHRAIFFQRPLKSQKGLIGSCTFEKGKSRCPISHPRFEEFRMWSFLNNVKVKTYLDDEYRPLNEEEIAKALPMFYRKSKPNFDFEDIAKSIAGKKKGCYAYREDKCEAPYRFNFRMTTSVSGSPVTAQLKDIFGEEWEDSICEIYLKGENKSGEQVINDIWHSLYFFDDNDKLYTWAKTNLQLEDEEADKFTKIKIPQDYGALSLCAINKILPWLRIGYRYDEAVFLANLSEVVSADVWSNDEARQRIVKAVAAVVAEDYNPKGKRKEDAIYEALLDCGLYGDEIHIERLYHPSMIETYQDAKPNEQGLALLASPRTSSVRNPMAMRALFRMRALVNQLIKEGKIDSETKINIEFARGLNNANKRKAIEVYQRDQEKKHKEYAESIRRLYREECGVDIEPTYDDILKYQLWEEQGHLCLYTGQTIGISDFVGANPRFDIEHTVPRSRGGDNSQMNKTLCESNFNRNIKKGKLPAELATHAEILARIEQIGWEAKCEELHKQIERTKGSFSTKEIKDTMIQKRHRLMMELDYWRGKLARFTMTEVPEGFSNRQGVDIGIIGRYARLYLKTVFEKVYVVKGATTADFRRAWGLQEEYAKKERVNHIHHCIDAITIACIDGKSYQDWAAYQKEVEYTEKCRIARPHFPKPWPTFTEDVKAVADDLLISHHTANNLSKHTRKKLRVRGKVQLNAEGKPIYVQGDTARASLHQQTFYGAIKCDDEIKYVVRKSLDALQPADIDKIVDDAVRECVKAAIERVGFKEAMSKPICFNEAKGVYIKKVRIYTPSVTSPIRLKRHQMLSRFNHKQEYYVANDGNYCMAIYEGVDAKGKIKRSFQIVNNLEAAKFYNGKTNRYDLVPQSDENDYPLKYILRTGTMVLFYEKSPEELYDCSRAELSKRLYKVTGMSSMVIQKRYEYGVMTLKHHQEARPAGELKAKNGEWKIGEDYRPMIIINHNQLNALVEGYDFELTVTGEIKFKH